MRCTVRIFWGRTICAERHWDSAQNLSVGGHAAVVQSSFPVFAVGIQPSSAVCEPFKPPKHGATEAEVPYSRG